MKKLVIFVLILFVLGCNPTYPVRNKESKFEKFDRFGTIHVVDGCEYAVLNNAYGDSYTHIGTCNQCWTRLQKMINEATGNSQLEKK